jgi:hypothetical protein
MSDLTAENFWQILNSAQAKSINIFYRLYYDEDGFPICYSMEELPHAFVDVDKDTFAVADIRVRVVDGKITVLKTKAGQRLKLRPAHQGICCDPRDICVVVDEKDPHIKWSYNTDETC